MSSGAFRTGWRVVRARRSEFVDAGRVRRRTLVCGVVAASVGTAVTVADVLWAVLDGPWALDVVAVVCSAVAAGSFVTAFVRVTPRGTDDRPTTPSGDWRRHERIGRQFAARPPAMLPEDRDAVLEHAERTTEGSVVLAERAVWIPVAWVAAWVGILAGTSAGTDQVTLVLLPPVFAVLQSASFIAAVTGAGRAEAARARAAVLPPPEPVDDPRRRHGRAPQGSKLALPDDSQRDRPARI
jgi:hypothetical protein